MIRDLQLQIVVVAKCTFAAANMDISSVAAARKRGEDHFAATKSTLQQPNWLSFLQLQNFIVGNLQSQKRGLLQLKRCAVVTAKMGGGFVDAK